MKLINVHVLQSAIIPSSSILNRDLHHPHPLVEIFDPEILSDNSKQYNTFTSVHYFLSLVKLVSCGL